MGAPGDLPPLRRQLQGSAPALDELHAERILELFHLHRESRLRDAALLRGLAEVAKLGEGDEVLKLAQRQHAASATLMALSGANQQS